MKPVMRAVKEIARRGRDLAEQATPTGLAELLTGPAYRCPICDYTGRFRLRAHRLRCRCPRCGSCERQRLAYAAGRDLIAGRDAMLHVAPEPEMAQVFRKLVRRFVTVDLVADGVNLRADLTELPFPHESFDVVFASHVLEHIPDDVSAIREIRRVLRPGGIALLQVPITADRTVEYPEPNRREQGHVRAPGPDYFDRYRSVFSRVQIITSDDVPAAFQTYSYEDRSVIPYETLRPTMPGDRHLEHLPVCYA